MTKMNKIIAFVKLISEKKDPQIAYKKVKLFIVVHPKNNASKSGSRSEKGRKGSEFR